MKKILCLIDTLSFGGGAERQMAGLAGLLHEKDYNVTLASYHRHNCNETIKARYGIDSIYIECGNSFVSKLLSVRKFISENNFDVIIAYKDGATMIACLCKMMGGNFKLIVSERNTTQSLSKRERLKFFLYRFADIIVPNSHAQEDFISGHYPNLASKVHVITNFTDTNLFKPSESYQYSHDKTKMLIVGRINPQKNVERFIKVVAKLKRNKIPISIDWYGGVYASAGSYGDLIKKQYEEAGIDDYLSFKGDTSNIAEVYRQYDVFCLPSLFEGFPNVVCEAMSSGKPILCSDVCDNSKIVQEGVNGFLFNPIDENDIAETIIKFCNLNLQSKLSLGYNSRKIAETLLSEETFVTSYMRIVDQLK